MAKGHRKGASWERRVAKQIVKAFNDAGNKKITQRDCWRSIGSGSHVIAAGDLEMSDRLLKLFPFAVECKSYRKIEWRNFLTKNKKSKEMKWITQAIEGGDKLRKMMPKIGAQALLLIRHSNHGMWVMDPTTFRVKSWPKFLKAWARGRRVWAVSK